LKTLKKYIKKLPGIKSFIDKIKPAGIEETLLDLFSQEKEILIVDIGANDGQSINSFLKVFPDAIIHSFEPTNELFIQLKKKYAYSNNVIINNLAITNYTGKAVFYKSAFSPTNSLLKPNLNTYKEINSHLTKGFEEMETEEVETISFKEYYKNNLKGEIIDIFKTDTQGNDYQVLEGAGNILNNRVKTVILEAQYRKFYEKAIPFYKTFELLYDLGFMLYNIIDSNRIKRTSIIESDIVFINNNFYK